MNNTEMKERSIEPGDVESLEPAGVPEQPTQDEQQCISASMQKYNEARKLPVLACIRIQRDIEHELQALGYTTQPYLGKWVAVKIDKKPSIK